MFNGNAVLHTAEKLPACQSNVHVAVTSQAEYVMACRWYNEDLLLDPYAPLVSGRRQFGVRDEFEEFEEKVTAYAYVLAQQCHYSNMCQQLEKPSN